MDTCTYTVLVYRQSSTDIFIIKLHIEDRIDNNKGITFLYIAWARWLDSLGTFEATLLSKISENSLCVDAWNPRGTVFAFQTKKLEVFDIIFVNFSGLRCRRFTSRRCHWNACSLNPRKYHQKFKNPDKTLCNQWLSPHKYFQQYT